MLALFHCDETIARQNIYVRIYVRVCQPDVLATVVVIVIVNRSRCAVVVVSSSTR